MKKRLIYWLAAIPLIFTACVEDEYAEGSRTPIQFTVNIAGDKGITRSNTVNDAWTNGDPVAVQMTSGGSSKVKKYKIVTGSPIKLVPDTDVEPFYWPNSGITSVTVSAWYPYAATKPTADNTNTSITDQSTADKYEAANLMETAEVTRAFNTEAPTTPFHLTFAHKMAKLIIVPYYYKNTLGEARTSRLTTEDAALTTTKAINLCSGNNAITAYRNNRQFEVLVAPQAIAANTEIIQLSFGNSTFKYKSDAKTLVAGETYTYNVNFNTAADSAISVTTTLTGATLTYDGSSHNYTEYITINTSVICNGKTLTAGTDYEIIGDLNETDAGTYTVTVRGIGQYSNNNTSSFTWTINQAHETQRISYATTHVYKTLGDAPFTNTLTNDINHGTVTYTSSNEGVAEVDSNGEVTIRNTGDAIITATVVDANYTFEDNKNIASYTLTVSPASDPTN